MVGCGVDMDQNFYLSIAYAGKNEEYETLDNSEITLLERKVNNAISNNLSSIQVRINDIIEYEKKYGAKKLSSYLLGLKNNGLEISVHLPSPVPDVDDKLNFNSFYHQLEQGLKLLAISGVTKYTIHPHYNRIIFEQLNIEEQQILLQNMSLLFANIINTLNCNSYSEKPFLAVENVPVRDINSYTIFSSDSEDIVKKKKKAQKNISYGMTIVELRNIIELTRNNIKKLGFDDVNPDYQIGVTFDTGHATSLVSEENKKDEMKKWFDSFAKDIRLFHIAPRGEHDLDKNEDLMSFVQSESLKRNISVPAYVENHYSFKTNNDLANICHKLNNMTHLKSNLDEGKKELIFKDTNELGLDKSNSNISNNKKDLSTSSSFEDSSKKNNRKLTVLKSNRINVRNKFSILQNPEIYAANKSTENKNGLDKPKVKKLSAPKPNSSTSNNNSNSSNGFVNILFLLILIVSFCFLVYFITYNFLIG